MAQVSQKRERRQASPRQSSGKDVISNLPDGVINCILVHLPFRDAVRTSALSTEWRYKWVYISDLIFSYECLFSGIGKSNYPGKYTHDVCVSFIDRILSLHVGSIRKFFCAINVKTWKLHQWIVFLHANGIRQLFLRCDEVIPSSLLSCQELCHLDLKGRLEMPPTFNGFPTLSVLHLYDLQLSEEEFGHLISNCPLLERLKLTDFRFASLKIHAPKLRYLHVEGTFKDFDFVISPVLVEMYIYAYHRFFHHKPFLGESNFVGVLGYLHEIRRLEVKGFFSQFLCLGSVPVRLSPTYDHLKYLNMDIDVCNLKETLAILCILRSSPNLQVLKITYTEIARVAEDIKVWDVKAQEELQQLDCLFNSLKVVKITGIFGYKYDLDLMRQILVSSPVLETMRFTIRKQAMYQDASTLGKLLQFPRASIQAKVIYPGSA